MGGADCSTVLGLFTSRSEGGSLPELTDVHLFVFFAGVGVGNGWVKGAPGRGGSHAWGQRTRTAEYNSAGDTKTEHGKETFTANWTTSRHPHRNLELLVKTLNMDCLGFSLFDFFFFSFFLILQLVIA